MVSMIDKTTVHFADETSIRVYDTDVYADVPGSPTKIDDGPNALSTLMGQIISSFNYGII